MFGRTATAEQPPPEMTRPASHERDDLRCPLGTYGCGGAQERRAAPARARADHRRAARPGEERPGADAGQDDRPDPADDERRQRGADPLGPGRDAGPAVRDAGARRRSIRERSSCSRRTTSASTSSCRCGSRTNAARRRDDRSEQRLPDRRSQAQDRSGTSRSSSPPPPTSTASSSR